MFETIRFVIKTILAVSGVVWMIRFCKASTERNTVDMIRCGFWATVLFIVYGI